MNNLETSNNSKQPASIVEGKWIEGKYGNYDHTTCSVCGKHALLDAKYDRPYSSPFCPHCGAKMTNHDDFPMGE